MAISHHSILMVEITFAHGTTLVRETDRRSDLPIVGNGPPGTFVIFPHGLRISLPTDQVVRADDQRGCARVAFGGMAFVGRSIDRLVFHRVREVLPVDQLSPERSYTMTLECNWVADVSVDNRCLWSSMVYKIVPAVVWRTAEPCGEFKGSPVDERDGFIHFSTAAQVPETAARHFAGKNDLLLVAVDAARLDLRWEPSRGGDLFPHLYDPLPLSAVCWVRPLPVGEDGRHLFPALD